jgi:FkbM family methyltransferase
MSWTPPESLEEKIKRRLIPPAWYIRYLYGKELARGEQEIRLIPRLADRAKVSLDVGANNGVWSYALLRHSQAVHAFEPNPKPYRVLESWAAGRIVLHRQALSDHSGRAELLIPKSDKGYSNQGASLSQLKATESDVGRVSVETLRLDDLDISNVGFMKIDVEGFESRVLEGARDTLRRDRPNMVIEIEERHTGREIADMTGEVCGYGYQCLALVDGVLTRFDRIAPERYRGAVHIYNFIFLPV